MCHQIHVTPEDIGKMVISTSYTISPEEILQISFGLHNWICQPLLKKFIIALHRLPFAYVYMGDTMMASPSKH